MPRGREADAESFYSGLLGLERVSKPANLAKRGGCWFRGAELELHLGVEEPFVPAKKAHPALQVSELGALKSRLEDSGADVWTDEPLDGYDRFYASDPFGNRIEFLCPRSS
jgi:catechol 2,3-dioxygenase-like lactoylglutathione lyase family enzyme